MSRNLKPKGALPMVAVDSNGRIILTKQIRAALVKHAAKRVADEAARLFDSLNTVSTGDTFRFEYVYHVEPFQAGGKKRLPMYFIVDGSPTRLAPSTSEPC